MRRAMGWFEKTFCLEGVILESQKGILELYGCILFVSRAGTLTLTV